jgi:hypothetical protein
MNVLVGFKVECIVPRGLAAETRRATLRRAIEKSDDFRDSESAKKINNWRGSLLMTARMMAKSQTPSRLFASVDSAKVRVVSYNILSDSLCRGSHYIHSKKEDLENVSRLARIKRSLAAEMDRGSVLCLQEVSRKWGADLVQFFEARGYGHAASTYSNPGSGYMGICIAWPRSTMVVDEVNIERLVESVNWKRDPDWVCPNCKVSCFGSTSQCFKCGTPKPTVSASPNGLPAHAAPSPATPAGHEPVRGNFSWSSMLGLIGLDTAAPAATTEGAPTAAATSQAGKAAIAITAPATTAAGAVGPIPPGLNSSTTPLVPAARIWNTWQEVSRRDNVAVSLRLADL